LKLRERKSEVTEVRRERARKREVLGIWVGLICHLGLRYFSKQL
jgi:hypothetical protein